MYHEPAVHESKGPGVFGKFGADYVVPLVEDDVQDIGAGATESAQ